MAFRCGRGDQIEPARLRDGRQMLIAHDLADADEAQPQTPLIHRSKRLDLHQPRVGGAHQRVGQRQDKGVCRDLENIARAGGDPVGA